MEITAAHPNIRHMPILAIDPGNVQTAWLVYDPVCKSIVACGLQSNVEVLDTIRATQGRLVSHLAIEMVASYGMGVGQTVFDTCLWVGRFIQRWLECDAEPARHRYRLVYRKDVKMHLCNSMRAKDSNIRQALMDRYGSTRALALGTKKQPGPLYHIKADIWSALAVAVTAAEVDMEWCYE